jgi:hypothetical protein
MCLKIRPKHSTGKMTFGAELSKCLAKHSRHVKVPSNTALFVVNKNEILFLDLRQK